MNATNSPTSTVDELSASISLKRRRRDASLTCRKEGADITAEMSEQIGGRDM